MQELGSWKVYIDPATGEYVCKGLSTDFETVLNTDEFKATCVTGSTAYCIDTQAFYMFEKTTNAWVLQ